MLKSIKVRDYMTRNLVTFRPEMDLFTAINRLLEHRISGAPVVDGQGHLVGLLSEGDCLARHSLRRLLPNRSTNPTFK